MLLHDLVVGNYVCPVHVLTSVRNVADYQDAPTTALVVVPDSSNSEDKFWVEDGGLGPEAVSSYRLATEDDLRHASSFAITDQIIQGDDSFMIDNDRDSEAETLWALILNPPNFRREGML